MKRITHTFLRQLVAGLQKESDFVFLDTARPNRENSKSYLFLHPLKILRLHSGDNITLFFRLIEKELSEGRYVAGWFSYELGYRFEESCFVEQCQKICPPGTTLAVFGVYSKPHVFDHKTGQHNFPFGYETLPECRISNVQPDISKETYLQSIEKIKQYLAAGDTYQVNYTLKLGFDVEGSPGNMYAKLRQQQAVSYGALLNFSDEYILSFSPELFFRLSGDCLKVRPMKGTAEKGNNGEEEKVNARFLGEDIKNRSENVMIVDLLRNDLAKLLHSAEGGRVEANPLFTVEKYETVLQMTSTVTAFSSSSLEKLGYEKVFRDLFPCGSVTGAPKMRTMEIISELEAHPRGVYTGAIGYFSPEAKAVFNVPIRTVTVKGNNGEMGIGSGIVYDSKGEDEWRECLLKANFLTGQCVDFSLLETLLWTEKEGYFFLEEHSRRLQQTAEYFLFHYEQRIFDDTLRELKEAMKRKGEICTRVRILLDKDGVFHSQYFPCGMPEHFRLPLHPEKTVENLPVVGVLEQCLDTQNPFFYHKTTNRDVYTAAYQKANKHGFADMLLVNKKKEITEGCISNVILFQNGRYYTPPVSCGLLAGIMRERLLARSIPRIEEKIITPAELSKAEAIFLCNSVRGVFQVRLNEPWTDLLQE